MKQREFIHTYNKRNRPSFNKKFFTRSDDDLVNAIKHVIYSCERDNTFTIKILEFEVIEDYDDVIHVLWQYEESIINKGKPPQENNKKRNKKKDNQFGYINLKDSDLKVIRVLYYIKIREKKNGEVDDTVEVYIAMPRIIDGFYYRLNGNIYSAMYQIVDASTYNNSTAKNAKKQSITFKTIFTPIRVYRYTATLKDYNGDDVQCTYFIANMFKKSLLLIKYFLAKFGLFNTIQFLGLKDIFVLDSIDKVNLDINYAFPVKEMFIVIPKIEYDSIQVAQSLVYTLNQCISKSTMDNPHGSEMYIRSLGLEFTTKDLEAVYSKGLNILASLEFIYDDITKEDLKLPEEDKCDIYHVLRWMMYEFNSLRQKDNLDVSTKKVRYAEYLASYYAARLTMGIYRISDKGDRADLTTIRKAIQIPPMYLINAITESQLVNYKNCVNDLDSLIALKYTYKGISGIGESSNAISVAYRSIHPSHLGRVDIDTSSNSDPGISGTICPLTSLYDGHFIEYQEPSTWQEQVNMVIDGYRAMTSKKSMYHLINNINDEKPKNDEMLNAALETARDLLKMPFDVMMNEEYIDGIDIFGDGIMFWLRE